MTSSRSDGAGPHRRKGTFAWLVGLATVLTAVPGEAQSTGAAPVAGADSTVAVPPESAGTDSAAVAAGDTLPRAGLDSAARPTRPAPPPAPMDSALGAACEGSGGGPPDLLMVTFRPSTTGSERAAVAREVGGTLVGTSEHTAPGAWYVRVPGSAGDRSVADRLILLSPVLEVRTTRCPS